MKPSYVLMIVSILFSFGLHVLGLMHLVPLWISGPILFLSLLVFIICLNDRKRFKGL
ncbi:hypothetical protein [Bacillus sp. FJAT-27251]|uniref:hypothetical protein n=1 Tax=Bacillus sp. FJAT-27251 TaxID=1684142 RepID=UPI000B30A3DA|nr:hypothetical protein [Bacillus sp. FJAT-27251]